MNKISYTFGFLMLLAPATFAQTNVTVTVENLLPAGGLFFTPVWVGFHNGTFDAFDVGGVASAELEAIAEGGDTVPISTAFLGSGVDGVVAPGSPFGPAGSSFSGTASANFSLDPTANGYFSFASMMIPSNDAFIGNDDPMAYPLFDGTGDFAGPFVIEVLGSQIYDAGTEVNNPAGGAAFSALGGSDVAEAMPIAMHGGLDDFVGTGTANSETITSAFSADTVIARITIVPEPSSKLLTVLAVAACGWLRRRKP